VIGGHGRNIKQSYKIDRPRMLVVDTSEFDASVRYTSRVITWENCDGEFRRDSAWLSAYTIRVGRTAGDDDRGVFTA
jgi:hypothetical protein